MFNNLQFHFSLNAEHRKITDCLKIAVPQSCPVCCEIISKAEIFDHVFLHCDAKNKISLHEWRSWIDEFFSSWEGKQFSMDISCFKCNYTCQFDSEFVRHIVADHVTCSCKYDKCKEFRSLCAHLTNSPKCKIVCPVCYLDKFCNNDIFSFPMHVLKCVPKSFEGNLILDISDVYPLCIFCQPARNILFTKFKAHLRSCHSKNL